MYLNYLPPPVGDHGVASSEPSSNAWRVLNLARLEVNSVRVETVQPLQLVIHRLVSLGKIYHSWSRLRHSPAAGVP